MLASAWCFAQTSGPTPCGKWRQPPSVPESTELWLWEDCFLQGGIAQAGGRAGVVRNLTVGLGVLPAPLRNVVTTAMEIATLEAMFPGRIRVGVGHGVQGWMRQAGAAVASPLTLMREYVAALQRSPGWAIRHRRRPICAPGRSAVGLGSAATSSGAMPLAAEHGSTVPYVPCGCVGPRHAATAVARYRAALLWNTAGMRSPSRGQTHSCFSRSGRRPMAPELITAVGDVAQHAAVPLAGDRPRCRICAQATPARRAPPRCGHGHQYDRRHTPYREVLAKRSASPRPLEANWCSAGPRVGVNLH